MGASPSVGPFWPVNVTGTQNMLTAAAETQVRRFIYLGAAMSLLGSPRPITGADESWPLQQPRCSGYAASKTRADQAVLAANGTQMATVVIRPGWVWGTADDPSTASFVQAVRAGHLRLIDGGRHRIVATHIDNLIHAVSLAINHGAGGYYVFDDGSTTVRDFLAGLLQAHGLTLPEAPIPGPAAAGLARALDVGWRITRRPGDPPLTRMIVELNRRPFLISDARARQELRYQPLITRQQGIQRLRNVMRATVQPANPGVLSADQTSGTLSTKTINRPSALIRGLQIVLSGTRIGATREARSLHITAGVCALAVKDFATVRYRSAHTTEDAQPRSQTVMTYSEPSPADMESVLEAAPQEFESPILGCLRLRVDHLMRHQNTVNDPG
jgi:nucleoside-diphosphate-sugar epimerase